MRENPPSDHSGLALKSGAQPSFQPSDHTQRQQKSKDSKKKANSNSKRREENSKKNNSLSDLLSKPSACRSHSFSSIFLSPHPSPLCHSPSTVRERLFLAVTKGLLAAAAQLPGLRHFLAQHIQGNAAAQSHPCKFPVFQEERNLFT